MAEEDRKLTANIAPFGLRMQPELKERIDAAAKASSRSINSEIVDRLNWSFFDGPSEIQHWQRRFAEQQERIGELQATLEAEREQAERLRERHTDYRIELEGELSRTRHRAEVSAAFRDDMANIVNLLRQMRDEDREAIEEIRQVELYLRSDAICLQAELDRDPILPSAVRPILSTELAKSVAQTVDTRTWLLTKAIRETAKSARQHEASAVYAQNARHRIEGNSINDQVLDAYLEEVDGLYTELHAGAFYDAMLDRIADAPDDQREVFKAALEALMPRLFKDWPDRWL